MGVKDFDLSCAREREKMVARTSISFHNLQHSESLEKRIQKKIDKILIHYPFLEKIRVVVDAPHRHKHKGNLYQLRIDIHVQGKELIVNRQPWAKIQAHENPYTAVNAAFKAANHILEKYADKERGQTKAHEEPFHGIIEKLDENYGYIRSPNLPEIYFHQNAVLDEKFKELKVGDSVHFGIDEADSEKPHAIFVKAASHHFLIDDLHTIRSLTKKE